MATLAGAAAHLGGHLLPAGGHGDHHAAYHAGHRARPGVDRAGDVSSSTSHLTGASLSRIKTCATVAKAVPKPSTSPFAHFEIAFQELEV